uniref:Entry-fusion complex component n=1 Tax=Strongyloides papillosus TaxID=174720 RepID=A0A0N5BFB1_STREA
MIILFVSIAFLSTIISHLIICSTEKPKANSTKVLRNQEDLMKYDINKFKNVDNFSQKEDQNACENNEENKNSQIKTSEPFEVPCFIPSETYKTQLKENDYEMIVVKN